MTPSAPASRPDHSSEEGLLRQPAVRSLLAARLVSQIGTSVHFVAQSWFIYELTHSGTILGLASVMSLLGPALLGGIGGHPTDRFRPRRVLLFTQIVLGGIAGIEGLLVQLDLINTAGLLLCTAALSVVATFALPAWQVLLTEMSGEGGLSRLTALNTSAMDIGLVVGSALAAPVIGVIGVGGAFLLNASSYAFAVAMLAQSRQPRQPKPAINPSVPTTMRHGLAGVLKNRDLLTVMLLALVLSGAGASLPPLLLILTAHTGGASQYGLFLALLSAGSLGGTVLTWHARVGKRAVFAYSSALGICLTALGFAWSPWLMAGLLLPIGALLLALRANIVTLVQLQTPVGLRGRVVSALQAALAASQIAATVGLTSLSDVTGARIAIALSGTGLLLSVAAIIITTFRRDLGYLAGTPQHGIDIS